MAEAMTTFNANRIKAEMAPPVVNQVAMGIGVYHISNKTFGIGAKAMVLVNNQVTSGKIKPISQNGIIKIGFQTTAPKTTGSLMLKIEAGKEA